MHCPDRVMVVKLVLVEIHWQFQLMRTLAIAEVLGRINTALVTVTTTMVDPCCNEVFGEDIQIIMVVAIIIVFTIR